MNRQNGSLRKAAVVIDTLDPTSADALLEQMGLELAARVRNAVMELGEVNSRERDRVMQEFMRVGPMMPTAQEAGIELDDSLARKLGGPRPRQPADPVAESVRGETAPFQFLHEAAGDTLTKLLQREHPQTIAVVAAHLPPERAADLVTRLPANLQTQVLRRIVDLEETDPEIVREVEREIELLHSHQLRTVRKRSAGLAAVRAILEAADRGGRKDMLENLGRRDRRLADQLDDRGAAADGAGASRPATGNSTPPGSGRAERRPGEVLPSVRRGAPDQDHPDPCEAAGHRSVGASPPVAVEPDGRDRFTFHDLASLDDAALAEVLRQAGPRTALVALAGAEAALVDRIVAQLPSREAKSLRRKLEQTGPLQLRDVEYAQQQLAQLAGRLAAQGAIQPPSARRFVVAA